MNERESRVATIEALYGPGTVERLGLSTPIARWIETGDNKPLIGVHDEAVIRIAKALQSAYGEGKNARMPELPTTEKVTVIIENTLTPRGFVGMFVAVGDTTMRVADASLSVARGIVDNGVAQPDQSVILLRLRPHQ